MVQGANDNDAGNNHHDNSDDNFHFNFNYLQFYFFEFYFLAVDGRPVSQRVRQAIKKKLPADSMLSL
jgi:hypothetical protein